MRKTYIPYSDTRTIETGSKMNDMLSLGSLPFYTCSAINSFSFSAVFREIFNAERTYSKKMFNKFFLQIATSRKSNI